MTNIEYSVAEKISFGMVKKGQVIISRTGEEFVFIKAMRKNVVFKDKIGKGQYKAPFDFFVEIKDEIVEQESASNVVWDDLKVGDLFALVSGETIKPKAYIFKGKINTRYIGIEITTGRSTRIDASFQVKKIDLDELRNGN